RAGRDLCADYTPGTGCGSSVRPVGAQPATGPSLSRGQLVESPIARKGKAAMTPRKRPMSAPDATLELRERAPITTPARKPTPTNPHPNQKIPGMAGARLPLFRLGSPRVGRNRRYLG